MSTTAHREAARIPLNYFGLPFGLIGLAGSWVTAAHQDLAPIAVGEALQIICAAAWLTLVVFYLRHLAGAPGTLKADLLDPVAAPFSSLVFITPMLLAAQGIAPHAPVLGRIIFDVFMVLTVLLGGWLTGQWVVGPLDFERFHPGYFLPTVAGGLVASIGATAVGQHRLAVTMLGLGLTCWLILATLILGRLFFRPALPAVLRPTMAIEMAPAAVASLAVLAINGGRVDTYVALLGGYGLLMVLAQLRILPVYLRVRFGPGSWSYTFSVAAVVTTAMYWVNDIRPAGHVVYSYLLLAVVTVLIGGIAVRTVIALVKRDYGAPAPAGTPAPESVGQLDPRGPKA